MSRFPRPRLEPTGAEAPEPLGPSRNRILRDLPPADRTRLVAALRPVTFALGDVLGEPGQRMSHLFFPTTAVVSSLYTTESGETAEMGLAGNDGVVGLSLFLGGEAPPHAATVVVAGDALKLEAPVLRKEIASGGPLQALLLRYTHAFITQISHTAVCNRLHPVERRLSRWLLMCHDRVDRDDLQMTQEFIASVLGGRRETVTVAAGRLQDAGLIRYSRGHIAIVDRRGLEASACECYPAVATRSRLVAV